MSNFVTLRPKPGDVVERVYHVECELWSDSSSTLLGAVVPATGKRYALRCWLDNHGAEAAVTMQQFVRAANSIRLFEQPGVVEVFGVGRTNGVFYSVTEWLEGATLERFLERHGRLSAREALALLLPCLEGLAAAHNGGITHGDVRPASVFVCRPTRTEPERARLGKFDCGRWPERPLGFRRWLSSDLYQRQFVSPEELQGAIPDARSDVYAVGVLLFVTLSGQGPFAGDSQRELDRAIVTGAAKPLSATLADVSPGLAELISRAMALDPAARFSDVAALLIQLARVEGHGHDALAKYTPEMTTYRWITPASQCVHPSLFDLPAALPDEVDARRHAGSSRVLRACLVLSLGLLSATVLHRMFLQPEVPLLVAERRQRMLPPPVAAPDPAFQFSPLVVPTEVAEPIAAATAAEGSKAARPKPERSAPSPRPTETSLVANPSAAESARGPNIPIPIPVGIAASRPVTPGTTASQLSHSAPTPSTSPTPLPNRQADVLEHMQLQ